MTSAPDLRGTPIGSLQQILRVLRGTARPRWVILYDKRLSGHPYVSGQSFSALQTGADQRFERPGRHLDFDDILRGINQVQPAERCVDQLRGASDDCFEQLREIQVVHHSQRGLVQSGQECVLPAQFRLGSVARCDVNQEGIDVVFFCHWAEDTGVDPFAVFPFQFRLLTGTERLTDDRVPFTWDGLLPVGAFRSHEGCSRRVAREHFVVARDA